MALPFRILALVTIAMLGWLAPDARGGATVDLLFVSQNGAAIAATNELSATGGDILTMAVYLRTDEPLAASRFSIEYDLHFPEMTVVKATSWTGVELGGGSTYLPPGVPMVTADATVGVIGSFGGAVSDTALPARLGAGLYQVGSVVWRMNDPQWFCRTINCSGGTEAQPNSLRSGLYLFGDGFLNAAFQPIDTLVRFGTGFAGNLEGTIPEPATASLLAVALLALAAGRRRHRGR